MDPVSRSLASIDINEFERIIGYGKNPFSNWLYTLCACAELLPISICISSARKRKFPIIYMNQMFETISGYKRQDMVGKPCSFLQDITDASEEDLKSVDIKEEKRQLDILRDDLSKQKPTNVILTNFTATGEMFYNLLNMKPIFENGEYAYVIAMQYVIPNKDEETVDIYRKKAKTLFDLLPDGV